MHNSHSNKSQLEKISYESLLCNMHQIPLLGSKHLNQLCVINERLQREITETTVLQKKQ
uniref:Uncharacterized protein n=1 Tax=Rhizophora mucronata TaxID=61149 RepID=A0A2P2QK44_RHIMU